eukprot:4837985-Pyramimonas_sp.AAC.1
MSRGRIYFFQPISDDDTWTNILYTRSGSITAGCAAALGAAGKLSRRTNQTTQEARICSHDGPIRRRKRGYILTTGQSDAGSADIFS